MSDRPTVSIELNAVQLQFLEAMVKQFQLPDTGKAIRCLVNYAMQTPASHSDVFKMMRCTSC